MPVYTVQSGDTLGEIAQRFDSSVRAIVRFNDIEDPDIIFPDQILCLPKAPLVMPVLSSLGSAALWRSTTNLETRRAWRWHSSTSGR
jgi:LysM repeat protein